FCELFPQRHILASDYHCACPDEKLWLELSKRGLVRLTPIYEGADDIQDFLPDETLSDDVSHKSSAAVTTTRIAFLQLKNVGLIDTARKSKSKCILLLRFLVTYLLPSDPAWNEMLTVTCDCDKTHRCWKASWLVPLKRDKWVYQEKNRAEPPSAESMVK